MTKQKNLNSRCPEWAQSLIMLDSSNIQRPDSHLKEPHNCDTVHQAPSTPFVTSTMAELDPYF